MKFRGRRRLLAASLMCWASLPASMGLAQELEQSDIITVWGLRESQVGSAFSASEGEVDFGRFLDRPLLRVGELAEAVPGFAATQHSGTGKANQYFARGFNLDHGTDFSIRLDGMPINLRTHAHGQGYLDINFMIPEVVERIRYQKGTAHGDSGDFSAAGSAAFQTFDRLPESFTQIEIGENNWRRFIGGANIADAGYVAFDVTADDGPWVQPEGFDKTSAFFRFNRGAVSLSGGLYEASWNATDQAPLRTVETGLISRLEGIDPSVGGETQRYWLNGAYDDGSVSGNVYVMRYGVNLFSNFTYFLDDPINGDQFEQAEERWVGGGRIEKTWNAWGAWTPRLGVEARYDSIDPIGLYRTTNRVRRETVRGDSVDQASLGLWGDVEGEFGRARLKLGARLDAMKADVSSDDPRNSGSADDSLFEPNASLAWRFSDQIEGYLSAGRGHHSNDARGAVISVDPVTGDPAESVPLLVTADGAEAGFRYERRGFNAAVNVWMLDLESELVYVGDAGATEAANASRRSGLEVTAAWSPLSWLTLDAAAAATRARFRDVPAGQDRIPLAPEYILTSGATMRWGEGWSASVTARRIGPAPLVEDNSVRSAPSTVLNGRLAYRIGRLTLAAEGLNLLDGDDADIAYFYASRLPGEPADGVEDIHGHPIPPRSFRVQARIAF